MTYYDHATMMALKLGPWRDLDDTPKPAPPRRPVWAELRLLTPIAARLTLRSRSKRPA